MDQARVMNEHVSQKAVDTTLPEAVQELLERSTDYSNDSETEILQELLFNYKHILNLTQGLTIGDKMSWDTSPQTGLFLRFTDFKSRKYSFSSPILSMQCCADVRATYRKQQTPQIWTAGTGEECRFFCSLKLPYLSRMSQQFCRRLSGSQKWPYILKKTNSTTVFMLGRKTPSGFLFVMFDFNVPIFEQLE